MTVICSNNNSRLAGCLAVRPKSQDCLSVWYYNICMLHLSTMSYSHFPHVIVYTWSASTSSCSFNTLGTAIKSQVEHCVCGVDGRMKEEGEMFKCPQKISPQSSHTFPQHKAYMFLILLSMHYTEAVTIPSYGRLCVPDRFLPVCTPWSKLHTQTAGLHPEQPVKEQLANKQLTFQHHWLSDQREKCTKVHQVTPLQLLHFWHICVSKGTISY